MKYFIPLFMTLIMFFGLFVNPPPSYANVDSLDVAKVAGVDSFTTREFAIIALYLQGLKSGDTVLTFYTLNTAIQDSVASLVADSSLLSDTDIKSLISDSVATHDNFSEIAGSVSAGQYAANSIDGDDVDESALVMTGLIDDDDLAAGAVDGGTGGEIADGSITAADLAVDKNG